MRNVLVLISSPAHPALNDGAVSAAADVLRARGATVGTPDWLAPEIACDLPFDGPLDGPGDSVAMTAIDAVVVPAEGRRKKLLVADMESTMIENEMLDELADFIGLRERIASIISCRCMEASHRIVARAVRDRRVAELEIGGHVEGACGWRIPVSGQDVEDDLGAGRFDETVETFASCLEYSQFLA